MTAFIEPLTAVSKRQSAKSHPTPTDDINVQQQAPQARRDPLSSQNLAVTASSQQQSLLAVVSMSHSV